MPKPTLFVFDSKTDYVALHDEHPQIDVIHWSELKFNPLQAPPSVPPKEWLNLFVDLMTHNYFIGEVGYQILLETVDALYDLSGVYQGKSTYPTLSQLKIALESQVKPGGATRLREAFTSLINRLAGLLTVWKTGLEWSQGFCVPELTSKHTIMCIANLATDHCGFLIGLITLWTYSNQVATNQRGDLLSVLFVIDEAELILGSNLRNLQPRPPMLFGILPKFREFRLGILAASQSPVGLDERAVISLANTKIIKNLVSDTDIQCIGRSVGLTAEQRAHCLGMPRDQAVVFLGERQPQPVLVQVPPSPLNKTVDWDAIRKKMAPILAQRFRLEAPVPIAIPVAPKSSPATRPTPPPPSPNPGPQSPSDPVLLRVLIDVINHPWLAKSERLKGLFGSSISTCQSIARTCVQDLYVKEFKIHVGGRSGTVTLWKLLPKGYLLVGLKSEPLPGIGQLTHKYLQHLARQKGEDWGYRAEIEMRRNGKLVDVGFEKGVNLIAIEVATTPLHEAINVEKDLAAGFDRVIIIAINQTIKKRVEKKLSRDLDPGLRSRVLLITSEVFFGSQQIPA